MRLQGCTLKSHLVLQTYWTHSHRCAISSVLSNSDNKSILAAKKKRSNTKHRHLKSWLFSLSLPQPQRSIQVEMSHLMKNRRPGRNPVDLSFMSRVSRVYVHLLICVRLKVHVWVAEGEWVWGSAVVFHFRLWVCQAITISFVISVSSGWPWSQGSLLLWPWWNNDDDDQVGADVPWYFTSSCC